MSMLEVSNLGFGYDNGEPILDRVNMVVSDTEIFVLMGPSGVGKTTLMKLINLLLTPSSGEIQFNFAPGAKESNSGLALRRRMTMVFQESALFNASAWGNVAYGALARMDSWSRWKEYFLRVVPSKTIRKKFSGVDNRVMEVLERLGLTHLEDRNALSLSAGERRRVLLARALITDPELLLLDEPTSNLDPRNCAIIESIIEQYKEAGNSIVLATHDMNQAERIGDQVGLLLDKNIVEQGPKEKIFSDPDQEETKRFIQGELVFSNSQES